MESEVTNFKVKKCECLLDDNDNTITLFSGFAAGSAILQGGIFGLSSMFPGKYTQAVMGGMVNSFSFLQLFSRVSYAFL